MRVSSGLLQSLTAVDFPVRCRRMSARAYLASMAMHVAVCAQLSVVQLLVACSRPAEEVAWPIAGAVSGDGGSSVRPSGGTAMAGAVAAGEAPHTSGGGAPASIGNVRVANAGGRSAASAGKAGAGGSRAGDAGRSGSAADSE